jgi:hypothetical protein
LALCFTLSAVQIRAVVPGPLTGGVRQHDARKNMAKLIRGSWTLIAFVVIALTSPAQQAPPEQAEEITRQIQQSHIDGNVPAASDFDTFLKRDLTVYFSLPGKPAPTVEYELLRDGPTQTGIAYPKFYVWVRVTLEGQPVREGAVRLAAIEKTHFEITHFIASSEIVSNPSQLDAVFPPPVVVAILEKAHVSSK